MKVQVVTFGNLKNLEWQTLSQQYLKLTTKFINVQPVALAKIDSQKPKHQDQLLNDFLAKQKAKYFLSILDEKGEALTSLALAKKIETKVLNQSYSDWIIVVGGPHGFQPETKQRAAHLWSLSPLTMAHDLAYLVMCEQLFRIFSIIKNHPYHNE